MGVAALILGLVSLLVACIPLCGVVALLPALVGLVLGIADIVVKGNAKQPQGTGIAATVLNALAVVAAFIWLMLTLLGALAAAADQVQDEQAPQQQVESAEQAPTGQTEQTPAVPE